MIWIMTLREFFKKPEVRALQNKLKGLQQNTLVLTIACLLSACGGGGEVGNQAGSDTSIQVASTDGNSRPTTGLSGPPSTPLSIYPVQSSIHSASMDYTLTANGQAIPVTHFRDYDIAQFGMGKGSVTLTLTKSNNTNIASYHISPAKLGIVGSISGPSLTFTVSNNCYLIVQLDGRPKLVIAIDPLETDAPAARGAGIFNVTDAPYNAVSSTTEYSTAAFQNALNDASAWGASHRNGAQGIVYVPSGIWTLGTIYLPSDVAFYLAPGAVLRYTGEASHYDKHWYKASQARHITWFLSTRHFSTNIKIYGRGTIDGNGKSSLKASNLGMNFLTPIYTTHFRLDGITFRESSSWGIMPYRSSDMIFSNMKILNAFDLGEDDGIDVMESSNVQVDNAIALGLDDNFSTKTWGGDKPIFPNIPIEAHPLNNVTFNNVIAFSYCYGLKVGQGVVQPQSNVTFKNAVVYDASVGIGIHHRYGTATASNILFENIDIERLDFTNANNRTWLAFLIENSAGPNPIDGVTVRNIKIRSIGKTPAILNGLPGSPINNVTFANILMPNSLDYATSLKQMNITNDTYHGVVTINP